MGGSSDAELLSNDSEESEIEMDDGVLGDMCPIIKTWLCPRFHLVSPSKNQLDERFGSNRS